MLTLKKTIVAFLRWSERYAKTDMVYLFKGMSWLTLGQVSGTAASFVSSIAFANLLSPETYGEYRYILSVMNILALSTLTGINTALMRAAANGFDASIFKAFRTRLSFGAFGAAAGMLMATYYLYQGNDSLGLGFFVVSFFIPLFYSVEVYDSYLKGKKLFKESVVYAGMPSAVSTAALIGALFVTHSVPLLLLAYFAPYTILRGIVFYRTLRRHVAAEGVYDPSMRTYGMHLSVMSVFSTIAGNLDKLLIWHLLGAAPLAIYSIAVMPVNHMSALVYKLVYVIFPKLVENDIHNIRRILPGKAVQLFIALIPLVALYILVAPALYETLFPQYLNSILYSQVFALTLLFSPLLFLETTFSAHAKIHEQYSMHLFSAGLMVVLLFILTPLCGIGGVVASYFILKAVSVCFGLFLFARLKTSETV